MIVLGFVILIFCLAYGFIRTITRTEAIALIILSALVAPFTPFFLFEEFKSSEYPRIHSAFLSMTLFYYLFILQSTYNTAFPLHD